MNMQLLKAKNVLTCARGPKGTANVTESQYMQEEGFTEIRNTVYL